MRLYIIGPVTGIKDDNIQAFVEAQKELDASGYTAYSPHSFVGPGTPHEEAMRICIGRLVSGYYAARALNEAGKGPLTTRQRHVPLYQGVALLDGWEQSEGARTEKLVAEACGIPCKTVAEWIEEAR